MAAPQRIDRIRGMTDLPLIQEGMDEAKTVAKALAKRGGLKGVSTSTLHRAVQTATILLQYNPTARLKDVTSALEPWHLGEFELQPSKKVHVEIEPYVENPKLVIPGKGAESGVPGENLYTFGHRLIPYVIKQVKSNPKDYGLVLVTHYRDIKYLNAWIKGGAKPDFLPDTEEFLREENAPPASLWCIEFENGKWILKTEDINKNEPLSDVYLLRHGATAMNGSSSQVLGGS